MKWTSIFVEGGLFSEEYLESLSKSDSERPGQKPKDFGFDGNRGFVEEVSAYWGEAKELYSRYQKRTERLLSKGSGTKESPFTTTYNYWIQPFLELLEYQIQEWKPSPKIEEKLYPISHRDIIPIHVVGYQIQDLGDRTGSGNSPHSLLQEFLNRSEEVWGLVTNGKTLRLLRNSSMFTRQTYLEFDLEKIFTEDLFDEFLLLFRLLHRSRLPKATDDKSCYLEEYHSETIEEGGRIREHLQEQVKQAIVYFGNGFLKHPENEALRNSLMKGELSFLGFYSDILYLIYRLLFLLVAEERKLLGDPKNPNFATYGMSRLREIAKRIPNEDTPYDDLFRQTKAYFRILNSEPMAKLSGLPALGGELFRERNVIDRYEITNRYYIRVLRELLFFKEGKTLTRINYSALNVEELGSVYESLLDFSPFVDVERNEFVLLQGTERKSTGSHYTHSDLVAEAIRQSLIPKIEEVLELTKKENAKATLDQIREKQKTALLQLKVLDPSCGSGHFLLASARILGREIAKLTYGTEEPTPSQIREGVRQSISHNIYGVDKNPLAVDLCKTALWIEGYSQGKPLGFLDAHIRCGDSLVGVFDLSYVTLGHKNFGIPDAAYTAVGGDDKSTATKFRTENLLQRKNQIHVDLFTPEMVSVYESIVKSSETIERESEDSSAPFSGGANNSRRTLFQLVSRNSFRIFLDRIFF
ncbi:MAG: N-6 DNA methylase [Leptospira sp.]|nr:N-6 DNA methylase [Leptospira sp.]